MHTHMCTQAFLKILCFENFYFMCKGISLACVSIYYLYTQCPQKPDKEDIGFPRMGVSGSCELACRCWKLNLSLLEQQPVLSHLSGPMNACHRMYVAVRGQLEEISFLPCHVGFGDQTPVIGLCGSYLYLPSHLSGPVLPLDCFCGGFYLFGRT